MTEDKMKIMCSETYEFLNLLGETYIKKIPKGLYKYIKQEKIQDYSLELNMEQRISEQISEESLLFIMYLNLIYWATQEEKEKLIKIYKENDVKEAERLKQLYNTDNLFKKRNEVKEEIQEQANMVSMVEYKEPLIKRIINKIKDFLRK